MTQLVRRSPFEDFNEIHRKLNRFFYDDELLRGSWAPPVDVSEEGDNIVVRAELAGMKEDDIDVQFENGILTLKGERQFESEENRDSYYRVERSYGTFVRSFTLPRTVDPEGISASYRNGLLEIVVPKREDAKPRRIKIGVETN